MYVSIIRRIYIESKYLTSNIYLKILEKIKLTSHDECSKEYGYILKIKCINKILTNENNIFTVSFQAEVFKPELNETYDAVICMIHQDGIFAIIKKIQKILIPHNKLLDYNYNSNENIYIHKLTKKILDLERKIIVTIDAIKFNTTNFSCLGSLSNVM